MNRPNPKKQGSIFILTVRSTPIIGCAIKDLKNPKSPRKSPQRISRRKSTQKKLKKQSNKKILRK